MDSLLIILISLFLPEGVTVQYCDCYFFRDVEGVRYEITQEPFYWDDYNGMVLPPDTIIICTRAYEEPYHYRLKTTWELRKLMEWGQFWIFFTALHEICHYKHWLEGDYPDEDVIDLKAEELIRDNFAKLKPFF